MKRHLLKPTSQSLKGLRAVIPEGERTPLTPPPGPSSSLVLRASSWSAVMTAEAANWALAWSTVLARPWGRDRKPVRKELDGSEEVLCVCDGLNTHMSTVCSGGAVGLLLQLDLLQLLFVHQGQLLLMLLVLFGCESWGRQMVCYRPEQTRAPSFTENA